MSTNAFSQNLQLHYDLASDRKFFTTTLEMFKADKLGNTFFFADMDYYSQGSKGVTMAYWEISRVIKTKKMPIGLHVEYDGGFGRYRVNEMDIAYRINDAALAGVDYSWNNKDFTRGFAIKAMYKHIADKHDASFQLTAVYFAKFFKNKLHITGFADFWREDSDFDYDGKADAEYIFLAEPQLWYYLNDHFCIGGEVEFSNNFQNLKGFYTRPTLGLKWIF